MSEPVIIDARRLLCPMPVIRVQEAVRALAPGDRLTVLATDPGSKADVPTWCRINGHEVLEVREDDDEIRIDIRVGGD